MKTYEYKGFNRVGQTCKGLIEALSIKEAREKLIADNILAEKVQVTGKKLDLSLGQRAILYREMSSLLGAGFPLARSLEILINSPDMANSNVLVAGVRDRIREGASLADALSMASKSITPFEYAIIQSAEKSATVESMLERLASFLEEQERLRERVRSALIYPSIVLTVGICVAMLMLGLLVPRAREIIAGNNVPMPILTRFTIAMGAAVVKWGWLVVLIAVAGVYHIRKRLSIDADLRKYWDKRLFDIPVYGRGRSLLVNLRFSRTMAILIHSGVSVVDSIILAGRSTGSEWIAQLSDKAAEMVKHGGSLSNAIGSIPPLADSLPGWLQVGEASGNVDRLMESAGQRYQSHWDRFVENCLTFLEPILILLIGGFVLVVTLSVLMPIISLSQSVGK